VFDGKMWVIGGRDYEDERADVWCSSDGVTWTQATDSAAFGPRCWHASVVFRQQDVGDWRQTTAREY
jgi:hypothetical protein